MRFSLLIILSGILCVRSAGAESSHPFSIHDMLAMDRISGPQVSPDGSSVLFTVRKTDLTENKG